MSIGLGRSRVLLGALVSAGGVGALTIGAWGLGAGDGPPAGHQGRAGHSRPDVQRLFESLPVRFEANRGQAGTSVGFLARGPGYTMALGRDGAATLALQGSGSAGGRPAGSRAAVTMYLAGGSSSPPASGADRIAAATNYLIGSDPRRWRRGVPSYARVRYREVYPGVDMVYRGSKGELEYDFVVAPGSDPARIAVGFRGAQRLSISSGGDVLIQTRGGTIRQRRPLIYQGEGSARRRVAGRYVLEGAGRRVGFRLGAYDRSKPLVIDPAIAYATHLGGYNTSLPIGSSVDTTNGITVDSAGNAYVVGYTDATGSTPFPTTSGSLQSAFGGGSRDGFVTKFNAAGALVYSTYLGGGAEDRATDVAVNSSGNAYVSGFTASGTGGTAGFPTKSPLQAANGGGARDGFVAVLNAAGTDLVYSTYLGDAGTDTANRIDLDSTGAAYLSGTTSPASSSVTNNFPTTAGSVQPAFGGGAGPTAPSDAFVSKIKPDGSALDYSTFLGGTASDSGASIAVDSAGAAYVAGSTSSAGVFGTAGAFQTSLAGASDAYVAKIQPDGSALNYATYLGSARGDSGAGVAVDSSGRAYVTGGTSGNAADPFPTRNAAQPANASAPGPNDSDAFVTRLNSNGTDIDYSTYLGSPTYDNPTDVAVDSSNSAYVVGNTLGSFPLKNPVQVRTGDYDSFLTKLSAAGTITYSTIYGGGSRDFGNAVAADSAGNAYIGGRTDFFAPGSFPTKNAVQPQNGGFGDAWAAKISAAPTSPLVNSLRSRGGPVDGGTTVVLNGTGLSGATSVKFGDAPAASFSVDSDSQITAVSPPHAAGKVAVTVTAPAGTSPDNPVDLFEYAEGMWRLTGSLNVIHYDAQLKQLTNGRVLMIGGQNSMFGSTISSTEVYDPKTRTWSNTSDLNTPRSAYTATRLDGPACRSAAPPGYCGDILVAGGSPNSASSNTPLSSAEIYDAPSGTWTDTAGTLSAPRSQHAATLLDGPECHAGSPPAYCGKVLVAGGLASAGTVLSSAELYDPASGLWTTTASLKHTARLTTSVLLPDGKVLLPGGNGSDRTASEVYDPAAGSWSDTGKLNIGRERESVVVLDGGKVLVASGIQPGDPPQLGRPPQAGDSAELFDPATGNWTLLPDRLTTSARNNHDTALLPSGKVLLSGGGRGGLTSEVFDPAGNAWTSAGLLNISRGSGHPQTGSYDSVVLSSGGERFAADAAVCGDDCGKVLVAGNTDDRTAELYTPPPRVDALGSQTGPEAGGASVTITGQGFTHGVRSVLFGATPATSFTVDSYGQITAIAPAGTGSAKVTVVNDGGSASSAGSFTYVPAPQTGGPGPSPPPQIPIVGQVKDVTAPLVNLGGKLAQSVKRGSIYVNVITDEDASLAASATVSRPTLRAKKTAVAAKSKKKRSKNKIYNLATVKTKIKARTKLVLKIKLTKKALKAVKKGLRRGRRSTARVRIFATDAAGNTRLVKRQIRIKD